MPHLSRAEVEGLYADMEPMDVALGQLPDSAPLPHVRAADLAELDEFAAAEMQYLGASDGEHANGRSARDSPVAERWGDGDEDLSYG